MKNMFLTMVKWQQDWPLDEKGLFITLGGSAQFSELKFPFSIFVFKYY